VRMSAMEKQSTAYNRWLHHSFVLVKCSNSDNDVMVDANELAGHIRVREMPQWRPWLMGLLSCTTVGKDREAVWRHLLELPDACPLTDGATSPGLNIKVVL
jgi:hypothetical protein